MIKTYGSLFMQTSDDWKIFAWNIGSIEELFTENTWWVIFTEFDSPKSHDAKTYHIIADTEEELMIEIFKKLKEHKKLSSIEQRKWKGCKQWSYLLDNYCIDVLFFIKRQPDSNNMLEIAIRWGYEENSDNFYTTYPIEKEPTDEEVEDIVNKLLLHAKSTFLNFPGLSKFKLHKED